MPLALEIHIVLKCHYTPNNHETHNECLNTTITQVSTLKHAIVYISICQFAH